MVALIAPAGPVPDQDGVRGAVNGLEKLGFAVKVFPGCSERYGYLSGRDEVRARDVNAAFSDPEIGGVICLRGGYGTPRILDRLDYAAIAANPKIFCGYSDITGLHVAFERRCGFPTFHAPMPVEFSSGWDEFTWNGWLRAVTSVQPLGLLRNPPGEPVFTLLGGCARGPVIGGNLSLIAAGIGTPYEIDTAGRLLLLEDIGEEPYRIDRMLTQLRLAGKFRDCAGVIVGDWHNCGAEHPEHSLSVMQVLEDVVLPCGKPAVYNLKAGHCKPKVTVPFGVEAVLDADAGTVCFVESAAV